MESGGKKHPITNVAMKRFALYILVITCILACRHNKPGRAMEGMDLLHEIFPTYSYMDFAYNDIILSVIEQDSARFSKMKADVKFLKPTLSNWFPANVPSHPSQEIRFTQKMKWVNSLLPGSAQDSVSYLSQAMRTDQVFLSQAVQAKFNGRAMPIQGAKKVVKYAFGVPILNADGNRAVLVSEMFTPHGEHVYYALEKTDGKWKITAFRYFFV